MFAGLLRGGVRLEAAGTSGVEAWTWKTCGARFGDNSLWTWPEPGRPEQRPTPTPDEGCTPVLWWLWTGSSLRGGRPDEQ